MGEGPGLVGPELVAHGVETWAAIGLLRIDSQYRVQTLLIGQGPLPVPAILECEQLYTAEILPFGDRAADLGVIGAGRRNLGRGSEVVVLGQGRGPRDTALLDRAIELRKVLQMTVGDVLALVVANKVVGRRDLFGPGRGRAAGGEAASIRSIEQPDRRFEFGEGRLAMARRQILARQIEP